jgi:hypothetical protein
MAKLMKEVGFEEIRNGYSTKTVINRKKEIEMSRIFIQSVFRKPENKK